VHNITGLGRDPEPGQFCGVVGPGVGGVVREKNDPVARFPQMPDRLRSAGQQVIAEIDGSVQIDNVTVE
jgi:hypothetical protein